MASFVVLFWTRIGIFIMALTSLILTSVCFALERNRTHKRMDFQGVMRIISHVSLFLGTIFTVCQTPANQHPIEMRTVLHIPPVSFSLVFYIIHIAKGGYLGFGDECAVNKSLCVLDHFTTILVLLLLATVIGELVSGWFIYFDYDFSNYFSDDDLPRRVQPQQQQEEQSATAAAAAQAKEEAVATQTVK